MGSGILESLFLLTEQRHSLRKHLRRIRRDLSPSDQKIAARQLLRRCRHWPVFLQARSLAFYLPIQGEINPLPLMQLAHRLGKTCYLPRMRSFPPGKLVFMRWHPGQRHHKQQWHIREPRQGRGLAADRLDIIFMPLTGLDRQGNRLGMGGGFYDRTLAGMYRPWRVGLAHDFQLVDQVPACPWDMRLHAAVMPGRRLQISRPRRTQRKNSG